MILDESIARRPRVLSATDFLSSVETLWKKGLPPGDSTGWPSVDKLYTVAPGQLSIITGWPSSGKSEWLDAMLVNLARRGWRVAMFSPENQPIELHIAKLIEKVARKSFGLNASASRVAFEDIAAHSKQIGEWFGLIELPRSGDSLTAPEVIEAAEPWLARHVDAKRGLVIDPWNELEHWRPAGLSETEYVSKTLSHVRNWARRNAVHVWIVAHPAKQIREAGKLPVPRLDMISGSQHWWNKADCGVTIWRDLEQPTSEVQIHVQKIRFKHIGRQGVASLNWDRATGTYAEPLTIVEAQAQRYRERDD